MLMTIAIVIAQVFVCCAIVLGVLELNIENDESRENVIVKHLHLEKNDEMHAQVKNVHVFDDEEVEVNDEYDIIVDDEDEVDEFDVVQLVIYAQNDVREFDWIDEIDETDVILIAH